MRLERLSEGREGVSSDPRWECEQRACQKGCRLPVAANAAKISVAC